jgi:hypothetical protein
MNEITQILDKIKNLLILLQFKTIDINGEINYAYENTYCIPHYIQHIGFFIEYAHSLEEAQKSLHSDGDGFPLEMGENAILAGLEAEIRQSIAKKNAMEM